MRHAHRQLLLQHCNSDSNSSSSSSFDNHTARTTFIASDLLDTLPRFHVARGLQFVLPYYFTFAVPVKGRWAGKSLKDAFSAEFPHYSASYIEAACKSGRLHVVWDQFHQKCVDKKKKGSSNNKKKQQIAVGGDSGVRRARSPEKDGGEDDDNDTAANAVAGSEEEQQADDKEQQVVVAAAGEAADPKLELKIGMIVLHTAHRHEMPVLATVDPVQIVDFVHVPSSQGSTGSGIATSSSSPSAAPALLRGVIVINKPPSIPVHACGRYFANTVQHLLRCGKFSLSNLAVQRLAPFLPRSSPAAIECEMDYAAAARSLLQDSVFGKEGDSGGLHSVHRLDKNTSGVLLFATCPEVSSLVFAALTDKSTESNGGSADGEDGGQQDEALAGNIHPPWEQPATSMRKIYLARVKGKLTVPSETSSSNNNNQCSTRVMSKPNSDNMYFLVQRSIFCASPKDGVMDCLTMEQEIEANAFRREKRRKAAEAAAAHRTEQKGDSASSTATAAAVANDNKADKRQRQAEITKGTNAKAAFSLATDDATRAAAAIEVAKWAATWFRIVFYDSETDETVVECHPVTGRTHQLRVHLAALGHPIVGDDVYGYKTRLVTGAAAAVSSTAMMNQRTSTVDDSLSWRADEWTRDFARLAANSTDHGTSAGMIDTTPLQPGVDHGFDPACIECNQNPQRRHFLDGSPFLALHAHRYRVSLPTSGVCTNVEAPIPSWAMQK